MIAPRASDMLSSPDQFFLLGWNSTDGIGSDAEGHAFERCQGPPGGTSQVRMGMGSLSRISCSSLNSHFFLHPPLKHFGVNCLWCDFTHLIFLFYFIF